MIRRQQLEALAEAVQGIPVLGCLPGSTASQAGVRYGDIVLEVNGLRTINIDDYLAGRKLRSDGMDLRLFRDGTEFSLFVELRPLEGEARWEALTQMLADARVGAESEPPPKSIPS
ncbi:MAG TPA: PDZ domain-containing protein [Polyangiaceae bacterium]|nr:PDZ domain-containing protein [Polyangiaceae bacterium]